MNESAVPSRRPPVLSPSIGWRCHMSARSNALTAPAVARNRDPILAVLRQVLPSSGTVIEIASGTGEHAVHFAGSLPNLTWQPTDSRRGHAAQHLGPSRLGRVAEPPRSSRARCGGRLLADQSRRCGSVHQHASHRALVGGRRAYGGGGESASARRRALPLRPVSGEWTARRQATRHSTQLSGPEIPIGACAISPRLPTWRANAGSS